TSLNSSDRTISSVAPSAGVRRAACVKKSCRRCASPWLRLPRRTVTLRTRVAWYRPARPTTRRTSALARDRSCTATSLLGHLVPELSEDLPGCLAHRRREPVPVTEIGPDDAVDHQARRQQPDGSAEVDRRRQ